MEFITAKSGRQTFYIEQDKVAAIIDNPVVHKVPEADEKIAGLSLYDGRLAVYLYLEERAPWQCGVLVDTGEQILYGITARDVGVADVEPTLLCTVITGVWVMQGD